MYCSKLKTDGDFQLNDAKSLPTQYKITFSKWTCNIFYSKNAVNLAIVNREKLNVYKLFERA